MSRFCAWLNGPQKKWSSGKSNADASIERAISASASPPSRPCQRRGARWSVAGQAGDRVLHRAAIAAEDPEDQRRPGRPGSPWRRRTRPRAGRSRPRAAVAATRRSPPARPRAGVARPGNRRGLERAGLVAGGERLAGGDARLVGALRGDPGRVRLDRQPLERRREARRRGPAALGAGGRLARLVVDLVDLGEPGPRGALDVVARGGPRRARRGTAAGPPPSPSRTDARVGGRRPGLGGGHVLVVRPLGGAERLGRRVRAGPGPGRDRAALVGDPALVGAGSGVRSGRGASRRRRPSSEPRVRVRRRLGRHRPRDRTAASRSRSGRRSRPRPSPPSRPPPPSTGARPSAGRARSTSGRGDQGRRAGRRRRGPEGIHARSEQAFQSGARRAPPRRSRSRSPCGRRTPRAGRAASRPSAPVAARGSEARRPPGAATGSGGSSCQRRSPGPPAAGPTSRARRSDRRAWRAGGPGSRSGRRSPGPRAAPAGATGGLRSERLRSRHRGPARGPGR